MRTPRMDTEKYHPRSGGVPTLRGEARREWGEKTIWTGREMPTRSVGWISPHHISSQPVKTTTCPPIPLGPPSLPSNQTGPNHGGRFRESVTQTYELTLRRPPGLILEQVWDSSGKAESVVVAGILPGSPAEASGAVECGDKVVAVSSSLGSVMWPYR